MTPVERIVASAAAAGIELDEDEAGRWLAAVTSRGHDHEVFFDTRSGVFGHRVAMLDFDDAELERFRWVGRLVEIADQHDVRTALALSGSAAQSKIQTFPGDCDFFERVHITAPSFAEACVRFGEVIRAKALATMAGDAYRLTEAKFGEYPSDVITGGIARRAGSVISWSPSDIEAGAIEVSFADGRTGQVTWTEAAANPGWTKLDWVVADPGRGELVNASNMLDATWGAPDGRVVPLDGYLDPYFQEVYLDVADVPLFTEVVEHVDADALDGYVEALEKEVRKYLLGGEPNIGKAAKRMYNVFRLNGRYTEAAFLRELFDEPANVLYQVYALVRTIDEAATPGSAISTDVIEDQLDDVIMDSVRALEGVEEEAIVGALLGLRDDLEQRPLDREAIDGARSLLLNVVNNFFEEKLEAMPEIRDYMDTCRFA